jgi:hypothetical protein
MYIGLRAKKDFNVTLIFKFRNILKYKISKILPVGDELLHAAGQMH